MFLASMPSELQRTWCARCSDGIYHRRCTRGMELGGYGNVTRLLSCTHTCVGRKIARIPDVPSLYDGGQRLYRHLIYVCRLDICAASGMTVRWATGDRRSAIDCLGDEGYLLPLTPGSSWRVLTANVMLARMSRAAARLCAIDVLVASSLICFEQHLARAFVDRTDRR